MVERERDKGREGIRQREGEGEVGRTGRGRGRESSMQVGRGRGREGWRRRGGRCVRGGRYVFR